MSDEKTYRYERKFLVEALNRFDIEAIIKMHPSGFSEIYRERYINNIYFDDPEWSNLLVKVLYLRQVERGPGLSNAQPLQFL